MRKIIVYLLIVTALFSCSNKLNEQAQIAGEKKEISQIEIEDKLNLYNAENINSVDLLEALDFVGVQIHKFDLGEFIKRYELTLLMEKYENGVLISTDTLVSTDNQYYAGFDDNGTPYMGFIDQLKIFTKTDYEKSELIIKTYKGQLTRKNIGLNKTDINQFFLWREYKETKWSADRKIPLMIFASSWFDERIDNHRFCGVAKLTENTESTDELLNNSPNYILISYKVTE